MLFGGDEPQFRLQLHWWCYCVFGAGGAFEGEEMYTPQHVLRAPLQCIGGRWCVIQRSIGLPPCICMYSIDMCVLQTWTRWTINYGIVCFKVCFFQIAFGTLASLQCSWKKNIIIPASGTLHSNLMYLEEHHCKELGRRTLALQCTWKRGQGDREGGAFLSLSIDRGGGGKKLGNSWQLPLLLKRARN